MKRAAVLLAWLAASSIPAAAAAVFYFGCCVLPFHRALHRLAPLCATMARHSPTGDHPPATAANHAKQKISKVVAARAASSAAPSSSSVATRWTQLARAARNICSHGALRVDDDIGLKTLYMTFLL